MNAQQYFAARLLKAKAMARGEYLPPAEAPLDDKKIESYMLRTGCSYQYAKLVVPRKKPTLYTRSGE